MAMIGETSKKALVADDHELYREGLAQFLKDEMSFSEVGEAATLDEAMSWLDTQGDVELALFDLSMPGMIGPQSLQALHAGYPDMKVAIVAASEAKRDVIAAIAAGLNGYIPKTLKRDELLSALQAVLDGQIYVPKLMLVYEHDLAKPVDGLSVGRQPKDMTVADPQQRLTPRQREVLDCIKVGLSNPEISRRMGISVRTVKIHVGHLLRLFHVHSRMDLALHDKK